jgi:hypothetical protein
VYTKGDFVRDRKAKMAIVCLQVVFSLKELKLFHIDMKLLPDFFQGVNKMGSVIA